MKRATKQSRDSTFTINKKIVRLTSTNGNGEVKTKEIEHRREKSTCKEDFLDIYEDIKKVKKAVLENRKKQRQNQLRKWEELEKDSKYRWGRFCQIKIKEQRKEIPKLTETIAKSLKREKQAIMRECDELSVESKLFFDHEKQDGFVRSLMKRKEARQNKKMIQKSSPEASNQKKKILTYSSPFFNYSINSLRMLRSCQTDSAKRKQKIIDEIRKQKMRDDINKTPCISETIPEPCLLFSDSDIQLDNDILAYSKGIEVYEDFLMTAIETVDKKNFPSKLLVPFLSQLLTSHILKQLFNKSKNQSNDSDWPVLKEVSSFRMMDFNEIPFAGLFAFSEESKSLFANCVFEIDNILYTDVCLEVQILLMCPFYHEIVKTTYMEDIESTNRIQNMTCVEDIMFLDNDLLECQQLQKKVQRLQ